MHLDKKEEFERNFFRIPKLILFYIAVSAIPCFIIEVACLVAFDGIISLNIMIPLVLIICGIVIIRSLPSSMKIVKGNNVLMTVNPLATRTIENGQTDFNEHTTGLHVLWPFEEFEEDMDIEKDIVVKLSGVQISVDDDDIKIDGSFTLRPNIRRLSIYKANGKNHAERVKNVTEQTYNLVVGMLETELSSIGVDTVFKNRKVYAAKVSEKIRKEITGLCNRLGVVCNDITIGDMNYSEDTAKARRVRKMQAEFDEAVEASDSLKEMSGSERMQHLRMLSDQSKGSDFHVSGLERVNLSLIPKELIEALKPKKE